METDNDIFTIYLFADSDTTDYRHKNTYSLNYLIGKRYVAEKSISI